MGEGGGRSVSEARIDDLVLPFQTIRSRMIGRIVRLGAVADTILKRHDYPEAVSETLGEALGLTALLGTALNFDGRFILQTRTNGPLGFLVTQFETPGFVRGYASFQAERVSEHAASGAGKGVLMGHGHLAMTIDPGEGMERHQGIVMLEGHSITEAAHTYFRQSEQLPTFIRLAVARHFASRGPADRSWHWRVGGLMVQHVAPEARSAASVDTEEHPLDDDDDHWQRVSLLASTVEDHELTDPTLSPEALLYRLFHEEGVRVRDKRPIDVHCRCSRRRVGALLRSFGVAELQDMREADGAVTVTCEFCNTRYRFTEQEIQADGSELS